jgi:catechol 2,3-dioxygenase-like lactoylglutathione lyase family enzyme
MLDHLSLQCDDVDASLAFYLDVFAPIGIAEVMRYDGPAGPVVGLGNSGFPSLWLSAGEDSASGENRPVHLALAAPDRAAVTEVARRAAARGAEVLHEPRVWPEYHPAYFGVFLRDPDGHNVEAVCHVAE